MFSKRLLFVLFFVLVIADILRAQRIVYSEPEKDDSRRMVFEIIGKIDGNFLIYKNLKGKNWITIYDNDMKEVSKIGQEFMPDERLALRGISGEATSDDGRDSEHASELVRYEHALQYLGTVRARHREASVRKEDGPNLGDATTLLLERHIVRNRERCREIIPPDANEMELAGLRIWQWAQEDGADHAEDCCRAPDAERQRDHDRRGEAGIAPERARRKAEIGGGIL